MQLGSGVAVAVVQVGGCSSDSAPRLGNLHIPLSVALKKEKQKLPIPKLVLGCLPRFNCLLSNVL